MLLVVSGPSGSGKTTVIGRLREVDPTLGYSISCTTREPRPGEIDGVHYHFLTNERFLELLHAGQFIEHELVHGRRHYYGTLISEVKDAVAGEKDIILDLDCRGATHLKRKLPDTYLFFLLPPTRYDLEQRIRARMDGMGDEEMFSRLASADREVAEAVHYDGWMVNEEVESSVVAMTELIAALREGVKPDWKKFRHPHILETVQKNFWAA